MAGCPAYLPRASGSAAVTAAPSDPASDAEDAVSTSPIIGIDRGVARRPNLRGRRQADAEKEPRVPPRSHAAAPG